MKREGVSSEMSGGGPSAGEPAGPSRRLADLPAYPLAGIPELKARLLAAGRDVIDLGAGDAGLPVPDVAVKELKRAAARPELQGYAFQRGLPELRDAIARFMERRYGRRVDPERELLPLVGSKEGLAHLAFAVVDPGDTVLIPDPGYAPYAGGGLFAGARLERVPLREEDGFLIPPERIRDCPGRLRLVCANYPNNPTGAVAEPEYLRELLAATRERGAVLAYDNAYAEVAFDGYRPSSTLELDEASGHAVEFHSFSKSFNMTGWRLGWVCGSAGLVEALSRVKSFFDTGPYLAIQAAGAAVLRDPDGFLEENLRQLHRRRDAAVAAFRDAGFEVRRPVATLYLWMPVPSDEPSVAFAHRIMEDEAVVLLPGAALGAAGEGYVRVALTVEPDELVEAARRISRRI